MRTAATCPQQQTSSAFAARLARIARRWWRAYWNWRAREATIVILRSLDARTLRDIGISPSEISSCVYGGRDRRRVYDERWSQRE
jgi:uncharacterized protein YjiS (DUF1127 family)